MPPPVGGARRTFLVRDQERQLRRRAEEAATPVARLQPGVIGSVRRCDAGSAWCEVQVGDYRGASQLAQEVVESDLSRGLVFLAWERELLPAFYLGEWDRVLEMGTEFREGWAAADKPPLAAMAATAFRMLRAGEAPR